MTSVYLDTSAALRTILETGTSPDIENQLLGAEKLITSRLSLVESARAFHRLETLGGLPTDQLVAQRRKAEDLWEHCEILEISYEVCDLAASLKVNKSLRALDAIHLATYLLEKRRFPGLGSLLTADYRLAEVARTFLS